MHKLLLYFFGFSFSVTPPSGRNRKLKSVFCISRGHLSYENFFLKPVETTVSQI